MATRTISNAGGNWNAVAAWAEGAIPTAADQVVATASSGNLVLTNGGSSCACRGFDMTNYTGTISGSEMLAIGDGTNPTGGIVFKLVASSVYSATNTIKLISTNTSTHYFTVPDGTDLSAVTIWLNESTGTLNFTNSFTIGTMFLDPVTTKTINISSGKTITISGKFYCYPTNGTITFTLGTISKASGIVNMVGVASSTTNWTGGATWNLINNCNIYSGLAATKGLTVVGGFCYVDFQLGNDTPSQAYGFYKVAYTGATGTCPVVGEILTGATSGISAPVTFVNEKEWDDGAGTIYIDHKPGVFVAEQVDCGTGGGHFDIATDFSNAAWLTSHDTGGATSTRVGGNDTVKFAKTADPYSVGKASVKAVKRKSTDSGYDITFSITSSTNASPIVVTKNAHTLIDGDVVLIVGHTTNVGANGAWVVANKTTNTFELVGSVGTGTGTAVGTVNRINNKGILLNDDPGCIKIDNAEIAWTNDGASSTALVSSFTSSGPKEGGTCLRVITPSSGLSAGQRLCWFNINDIDLSSCDRISFWVGGMKIDAGQFKVCLHDNDTATNIIDTFSIPDSPNSNISFCTWNPHVIRRTGGGALGSSIKSISIHVDTITTGIYNKTVYFDHFFASKTGQSIDLLTLLSRNPNIYGGYDEWYTIQSINNKVIVINNEGNDHATRFSNVTRGYGGPGSVVSIIVENYGLGYSNGDILTIPGGDATATITVLTVVVATGAISSYIVSNGGHYYDYVHSILPTGGTGTGFQIMIDELGWDYCDFYARQALVVSNPAISSATTVFKTTRGGSIINPNYDFCYYKGGYNPSTGLQDGETFLDGQFYSGIALYPESRIYLDRFSFVRFYYVLYGGCGMSDIRINHLVSIAVSNTYGLTMDFVRIEIGSISNGSLNSYGTLFEKLTRSTLIIHNQSSTRGVLLLAGNSNDIYIYRSANCSHAIQDKTIESCIHEINSFATFGAPIDMQGSSRIITFNSYDSIQPTNVIIRTQISKCYIDSDVNLKTKDHATLHPNGYFVKKPASVGGSGNQWEYHLRLDSSAGYRNNYLELMPVPCVAGNTYTFSMHCKKSNTDIYWALYRPGNELAGVSEAYEYAPNDTNYNNVSFSFTPTESGTIMISIFVYGTGTGSVTCDDISILVS